MKYFMLLISCVLAPSVTPTAAHRVRGVILDGSQTLQIPIGHDIDSTNLPHALLEEMLGGTGIPGGVAQLQSCSGAPAVHFKAKKETTIHEAMDAYVASNPDYQWQLDGGVLNLIPKTRLALLDTTIRNFQLSTTSRQMTANAILDELMRLAEVRQRAAELKLQPGIVQDLFHGIHKEHAAPTKPVPVILNLNHVSLRQAFNSVVRAYGLTIWIYIETECDGERTYEIATGTD